MRMEWLRYFEGVRTGVGARARRSEVKPRDGDICEPPQRKAAASRLKLFPLEAESFGKARDKPTTWPPHRPCIGNGPGASLWRRVIRLN